MRQQVVLDRVVKAAEVEELVACIDQAERRSTP